MGTRFPKSAHLNGDSELPDMFLLFCYKDFLRKQF